MPVPMKTTGSIRFNVQSRNSCPEDSPFFCGGVICGEWMCPSGTTEKQSCELKLKKNLTDDVFMEKYRLVLQV